MEELLSADQLAEWLGLDTRTVYRKARALGGVKFARRWFFDKKIVRSRLFGDAAKEEADADSKEAERQDRGVARPGPDERPQQKQALRHQGGSSRPRSQVAQGDPGRGEQDDPYGLGVADPLS